MDHQGRRVSQDRTDRTALTGRWAILDHQGHQLRHQLTGARNSQNSAHAKLQLDLQDHKDREDPPDQEAIWEHLALMAHLVNKDQLDRQDQPAIMAIPDREVLQARLVVNCLVQMDHQDRQDHLDVQDQQARGDHQDHPVTAVHLELRATLGHQD